MKCKYIKQTNPIRNMAIFLVYIKGGRGVYEEEVSTILEDVNLYKQTNLLI